MIGGMGYLGECDINTMLPESFGAQFAEQVRKRTTNDNISVEQMIDVLTGRPFRQTLLVHQERVPQIKRHLTPEISSRLHFLGPRDMKLERKDDATVLSDGTGRALSTREPAVATALERFLRRFPGSATVDECARGMDERGRTAVADAFHRMVVAGMISVSTEAFPAVEPGAMPKAIALARGDAAAGLTVTANYRHEPVEMDAAALVLMPLLNGKTGRDKLERRLLDAALVGKLTIKGPAGPVTDPGELRKVVHDLLPRILEGLAKSGLIDS
jgi:methyltransferase-like protein